MRKAVIAIIALLLVAAGVWGVAKSQRNYSYPYSKVAEEVARIASSSGANVMDQRTVTASLRSERLGLMDPLIRKVSGRPAMDDLQETTFQDGPDTVRVSVYHSLGKVGLVEIHPSGGSSKLPAALVSGLAASFRKLDCHREGP